jgi:hypothetical protein
MRRGRRFFTSLMRSTTQSGVIARAPTVRPKIAQGNALGWLPFVVKALKGRPNQPWFGRPCRAPSPIGPRFPGRCPGLSLAAPLGLVSDQRRSDLKCQMTKETALCGGGAGKQRHTRRLPAIVLSYHQIVAQESSPLHSPMVIHASFQPLP